MNQIDSKLPEIDERACNYALIEYSINNILKDLDVKTEVYDDKTKTIDSIYNSISTLHQLVKQQKIKNTTLMLKIKDNEDVISECKEEVNCMKALLYDQIKKNSTPHKSEYDDSMLIDDHLFRSNKCYIDPEAEAEYEFMERLSQSEKPEKTERKSNFLK